MRTFVRVDSARLVSNYRNILAAHPEGTEILAVVKADGYGHGAVRAVRALESAGCRRFAVATLAEAAELRGAGVGSEILLLGGPFPGEEDEAAALGLVAVLPDEERLAAWREAARRAGRALGWHLEVDTGMRRLGMRFGSADELARTLTSAPELRLEGVATHLAAAEDFDDETATGQLRRFRNLIEEVRRLGVDPGIVHASNSAAAAFRTPRTPCLIRPGLALYGYLNRTRGAAPPAAVAVRPALEWRATVLSTAEVAPGDRIGYSGTYRVERPTRVAVLGVGYADGYRRELSNRGEVLLGGKRRPVLGRVSMDLTTVEADESVRAGDEAILLAEGLDAREIADWCGTIPYEVLAGISARVPRLEGPV